MYIVLTQRLLKHSLRVLNRSLGHKLPKDVSYFAYGANMDEGILRSNDISPAGCQTASLANHTIEMSLPCEYIGKGFASVSSQKGSSVYGVVWKISKLEMALIDVAEWVPFSFYKRERVGVQNEQGETIEAFCYFALTPKKGLKTSTGYAQLLVSSAESRGFPDTYISHLKSLPTGERFKFDHGFNLRDPAQKRFGAEILKSAYKVHDQLREKLCEWIP